LTRRGLVDAYAGNPLGLKKSGERVRSGATLYNSWDQPDLDERRYVIGNIKYSTSQRTKGNLDQV